jgi:hypothetical protein
MFRLYILPKHPQEHYPNTLASALYFLHYWYSNYRLKVQGLFGSEFALKFQSSFVLLVQLGQFQLPVLVVLQLGVQAELALV